MLAALFALGTAGCAGAVPDPQATVDAYREAAARGDAAALYELFSEEGKRRYSADEVKKIVADEKPELAEQAKALASPAVRIKTEASLRYGDGERASLSIEDGAFRLSAADALPAESRSVPEALGQLRKVLARRSYAGLLRVLSPRTRAAMEEELRSLVLGLEEPEGLDVDESGDVATVLVPGGHLVRLRRENGLWHVEDFD